MSNRVQLMSTALFERVLQFSLVEPEPERRRKRRG
jgi:hypothetical protein